MENAESVRSDRPSSKDWRLLNVTHGNLTFLSHGSFTCGRRILISILWILLHTIPFLWHFLLPEINVFICLCSYCPTLPSYLVRVQPRPAFLIIMSGHRMVVKAYRRVHSTLDLASGPLHTFIPSLENTSSHLLRACSFLPLSSQRQCHPHKDTLPDNLRALSSMPSLPNTRCCFFFFTAPTIRNSLFTYNWCITVLFCVSPN